MEDTATSKEELDRAAFYLQTFFNLYSEQIMRTIEEESGFSIGGYNLNNIRYADDTTLIANSPQKLQKLLNMPKEESSRKGLNINRKKTFCMAISKKQQQVECALLIDNERIQQVNKFNYLGSMLNSDGRSVTEVKRRIAIAKEVFVRMSKILKSRSIPIDTRVRILNCYILPVLTYGCESWTLTSDLEKRLNATEMWMLRRMLRPSWTEHTSNNEVLRQAKYSRRLLKTIRSRQLSFLGHVMRKEGLENLAVTGKVCGKRGRGRQRIAFMKSLSTWTGVSEREMLEKAKNRTLWRSMTACVFQGHGT